MTSRIPHALASALLSLVFSSHAAAQGVAGAYPAKPIRMIVPFTPGGPADMIARPVAQGLTERLGQQVIIDNRPGAGGNIGAEALAKSAPDGYTMMVTTPGIIAVNPSLYSKIPFDTIRDFAGVTNAATTANIMIVHPSLPVKTVKDLIQIARARPGELSYASAGNGSASHLGTEIFKSMAKVNIVHVPYKGAAPGVTDLMGGHVQMMIIGMAVGLPAARGGKVKPLGVSSLTRSPAAPDLPTLNESGLPGFEVVNWMGFLVPARTPHDIVAKLNAEIRAILQAPDTRERLLKQGMEPVGNTPEEFDAYIKSEIAKWSKVVKLAGIKAD
ncbi:MAG: Bug family tripartite tricarboxylate transporter substrate binding protein [Burkholderiales bacterium]